MARFGEPPPAAVWRGVLGAMHLAGEPLSVGQAIGQLASALEEPE